jgi:ankyrin repeat protein
MSKEIVGITGKSIESIKVRMIALGSIRNELLKVFGTVLFFRLEQAHELFQINTTTRLNQTALHISAFAGKLESVKLLLSEGINCNAMDNAGRTALHLATLCKHVRVITVLIDARADVDVVAGDNHTPLSLALSMMDVERKVESGQNPSIPGPVQLGELVKLESCVRALKRRGAGNCTHLMLYAEAGAQQIRQYFKLRSMCLEEDRFQRAGNHSSWFQRKLDKQISYKGIEWIWSDVEKSSMELDQCKLSVVKTNDFPDFSCALGQPFHSFGSGVGIFIWEIVVYNVRSMWLGIASDFKGTFDNPPSSSSNDYLVVFKNDGRCPLAQFDEKIIRETKVKMISDASFTSGQRIRFKLDLQNRSMTMKVDGTKVASVENIVVEKVQAFVCMDYPNETAVLERIIYKESPPSTDSQAVPCLKRMKWMELDPLSEILTHQMSENGEKAKVLDNISRNEDVSNSSALHCVVANTLSGRCPVDAMMLLISANINIDTVDSEGQTALHVAVCKNRFNLVLKLIDLKANLDICDKDSCSALDLAMKLEKPDKNCIHLLRRNRLNGWTSLIHAAEVGGTAVFRHLQARQLLLCKKKRKERFPDWFQEAVQEHPNLDSSRKYDLRWAKHVEKSVQIGDDQKYIKKINDSSDYSCALCNIKFGQGLEKTDGFISTWKLAIADVQSMWLGIANIEQKDLTSSPFGVKFGGIVAVSCDGECCGVREDSVNYISSPSFVSGDTVTFEVDSSELQLRMWIQDRLAVIISIATLDIRRYSPFVCMDYLESVTITFSECYVKSCKAASVLDEEIMQEIKSSTRLCMENSIWATDGIDDILDELACERIFFVTDIGYSACIMN